MVEDESDKTIIMTSPVEDESDKTTTLHVALVVLHGGDIGKRYPLEKPEMILGRSPKAEIRIDAEGISRKHAKLFLRGGHVYIEDCGSTNGTFVNDQQITDTQLHDGDYLKVGDTVLKMVSGSSIDSKFQDDMYRLTTIDSLTQAFNKRYFLQRLDDELKRCLRYGREVSLAMFDIDHFKKVNDTYGHQAGDTVLRDLSKNVANLVRVNDVFCRYGGEEFAIILPESPLDDATVACEKIRKAIEEYTFSHNETQIPITISIGVKTLDPSAGDITPNEMIEAADKLLYEAKQQGRNRVCS
jgi:diguanylate cyclase (GGDEF)-like protein